MSMQNYSISGCTNGGRNSHSGATCKLSEPYDNTFWEKSNQMRDKGEKGRKTLLIEAQGQRTHSAETNN